MMQVLSQMVDAQGSQTGSFAGTPTTEVDGGAVLPMCF